MKKIKLNLNELKVNSFETEKQKTNKGTVQGFLTQNPTICTEFIECEMPTAFISCIKQCP